MEPLNPNSWQMCYSFSQPYVSLNPAYDHHLRVAQELLLLDEIDRRVQNMTEFPELDELLKGTNHD